MYGLICVLYAICYIGFRIQNEQKKTINIAEWSQIRGNGTKIINMVSQQFLKTDTLYLCDQFNYCVKIYPTPTVLIARLNLLDKSPLLRILIPETNKLRLKNTTGCIIKFENMKIKDSTNTINVQISKEILLVPNGSFDMQVNKCDGQTNIRLFDNYGNWLTVPDDEMVVTTQQTKQKPKDWIVGSLVEVYSTTTKSWENGTIIHITDDEEGEWLTVEYEVQFIITTKQVKRFDSGIVRSRPNKKRGKVYVSHMCFI